MRSKMIVLAILILVLTTPGCIPDTTESSTSTTVETISSEAAINIAYSTIPESVAAKGSFDRVTLDTTEGIWRLRFALREQGSVTFEELGWEAGPDVVLENVGLLPDGEIWILVIHIDAYSGEVLYRLASDNVPWSGPITTTTGSS
ncbi:hypothetical protein DGWBC_0576 [Dehalogenimonas sp. WBC-2]|nr:hypothetical protein DGWBC_0576 [Dehalogenimonas sp. WBC-2]